MDEFESVNTTETADLSTEEPIETVESTDADTAEVTETEESASEVVEVDEEQNRQTAEENAKYAAARRQAESEYNSKVAKLNARAKEMFGNYKHPVTGKPIESWEEYADAIEVQQRQAQEQKLREKGIDPSIVDQMVQNSPAMKEAKQVIERNKMEQAKQTLDNDIREISKFDPDIKSIDDLMKSPNYETVFGYVKNNNLSLVDAYRLANSSKLAVREREAAKQAAINSAKSTTHLETTRGVKKDTESYEPIPEAILGHWKEAYPGLSVQELTKKYNSVL